MPIEKLAHFIRTEQLQVGLYIHLDLPWDEHPFTFGSFKIKSGEQIEMIKQLGVQQIRYSPTKSDQQPIAIKEDVAKTPAAKPDPDLIIILEAKQSKLQQFERNKALRSECAKAFAATAQAVRNIDKQLNSRPKETLAGAERLVGQMLDTLLVDNDIIIHLMNDKAKGEELYFHSLNVAVLSLILARDMQLAKQDIRTLGLAALFHDIGKVEIPSRITMKSGLLSAAEEKVYQQHSLWSVNAAKTAGLPPAVLRLIAQHHEMCDGKGYPKGLKRDEIDPLARILALVNCYDNYCNRLNPAESLTPHEALSHMYTQQRASFDPLPLNLLIRGMGVYPPGSLVLLSNNCYALVIAVNTTKPLKPLIQVYNPDAQDQGAVLIDLEYEAQLNISKSIKLAQLPKAAAVYLSPCKHVSYYFNASEQ
ncbi:HD-GYP domain-containing protein [Iodobacter sp.]|uniref:HD-GYP domain-containing protein n=1 Tax=Iodobacter sp. TaxID=1915058 RepID=UPI0025E7AC9C|nr:HD-GYP domain-containing protein [Iodobacter sp.]